MLANWIEIFFTVNIWGVIWNIKNTGEGLMTACEATEAVPRSRSRSSGDQLQASSLCPPEEEERIVCSQGFPTSQGPLGVWWKLGRMCLKGNLGRRGSSPEKCSPCLGCEFFCWERELPLHHYFNERRGGPDSWFRTKECRSWKEWKLGVGSLETISSPGPAFLGIMLFKGTSLWPF